MCAQAGEVNTGAVDPLKAIADAASEHGRAWLHIDGAFGLWAAASPKRRSLVDGIERADSWAVDGHKWLNVPYDCGMAIVRDPAATTAALTVSAPYLATPRRRRPCGALLRPRPPGGRRAPPLPPGRGAQRRSRHRVEGYFAAAVASAVAERRQVHLVADSVGPPTPCHRAQPCSVAGGPTVDAAGGMVADGDAFSPASATTNARVVALVTMMGRSLVSAP